MALHALRVAGRKTIVKVFPQELFMIMRVITLFRGILGSLEVDVSSSLLWRDLAEDVLMVRPNDYRSASGRRRHCAVV